MKLVVTHHCSECGAQVSEFCAAHPSAIVDSILAPEPEPCDGTHRYRTGYTCAEHGLDGPAWSSNATLIDPNTPSQRRRD